MLFFEKVSIDLEHCALPFQPFSDHCAALDSEDEQENNTLWMSATQFSQLLDKQEAMEMPIQQQQKLKSSPVKTNSNSKLQTAKSDIMTSSSSFLDQQAMIPFKKLRQVTTACLLFF